MLHADIEKSEVNFKLQRQANCHFLEIAFRAIPRWDGVQMFWKLVIPRSGSFPVGEVTEFPEADFIVKEIVLEDILKYEEMELDE